MPFFSSTIDEDLAYITPLYITILTIQSISKWYLYKCAIIFVFFLVSIHYSFTKLSAVYDDVEIQSTFCFDKFWHADTQMSA